MSSKDNQVELSNIASVNKQDSSDKPTKGKINTKVGMEPTPDKENSKANKLKRKRTKREEQQEAYKEQQKDEDNMRAQARANLSLGQKIMDTVTNFIANIEFFTYRADALDVFAEDAGKKQKVSFVKFVTNIMKLVIGLGLFLGIFFTYVQDLGTEKSQSIKFVNHKNMTYNMTQIPRLLPVHHFSFFDTTAIIERMRCNYHKELKFCRKIEERRCQSKGKSTEAYEDCMIQLYNNEDFGRTNPVIFCDGHYKDMTIWIEKMHPDYLPYWIRLHGCNEKAGIPKGRQYCKDYMDHDSGSGLEELYACYTKYNVEFAKEYCDNSFTGQPEKLNQCYGSKGVPKGEEFCISTYYTAGQSSQAEGDDALPIEEDIKRLQETIDCFKEENLFTKTYCEFKMELAYLQDKDGSTPSTIQKRQDDLAECYKEEAGLIVDKAYCDSQLQVEKQRVEIETLDPLETLYYDCYPLIEDDAFKFRDREYCEKKYPTNTEKKYKCASCVIKLKDSLENQVPDVHKEVKSCIDSTPDGEIDQPGLKGDYCYFLYPWGDLYIDRYSCLKNQGVPQTSQFCEDEYHYKETFGVTSGRDEDYFEEIAIERIDCISTTVPITRTKSNGETEEFGPFGFESDGLNFTNDCEKWIAMPQESFIIEIGAPSSVEPSKDLTKEIPKVINEEEDSADDPFYDNFFNDTSLYFVGTHNSMYNNKTSNKDEASHTWILEPKQFSFINKTVTDESIKLSEISDNLNGKSFGKYLERIGPHFAAEEIAKDALNWYREEQIFYNPLLSPDDITVIEPFGGNLDITDFDTPEPAELVTGILGQASNPETPIGKIVKDIDNLFNNTDLPQEDSEIFKAYKQLQSSENQDKNILEIIKESNDNSTPIGYLKENYYKVINDPLFIMLPNTTLKEDDIHQMVDDLSLISLAFKKFKELYFASAEDSILRKICSEIERVILAGDTSGEDNDEDFTDDSSGEGNDESAGDSPQESNNQSTGDSSGDGNNDSSSRRMLSVQAQSEDISFEKLLAALMNMPFFSQLFAEFGMLMAAKPAELGSTFSSLAVVSEVKDTMNVDQIISDATTKRNLELYEAEINKETQFLILDFYTLIASKPLFGQVLKEFASMRPGGINGDDHPTITQIFQEYDNVFAAEQSVEMNIEDLMYQMMFQEGFSQLIDEVESILEDSSLYKSLHEKGFQVGPTAHRLFEREMTLDLFNQMNYILGNETSTAPLMFALNQVFEMDYTYQVLSELKEVLNKNLTISCSRIVDSTEEGGITATDEIEVTATDEGEFITTDEEISTTTEQDSVNSNRRLQELSPNTEEQDAVNTVDENDVSITDEGDIDTTDEGDVTSTDQGDVTATEEGDINTTDEDDLNTTEEGDVTTTDEGDVTTTDEDTSSTTEQNVVNTTEEDKCTTSFLWELSQMPKFNALLKAIQETNQMSDTAETFYTISNQNDLIGGLASEWGLLEMLIEQQLVQDYFKDYFHEICAPEGETCSCESGLIAFVPYDKENPEYDHTQNITFRFLSPARQEGVPSLMCSATEFLDLDPDLQKYCFCFIRDSDFLEIRHLEILRDEITNVEANELLLRFINELHEIQMIDFNIGYLQLNESLHALDFLTLDIIQALSNYSRSIDDGYISPYQLSQQYTNFFINHSMHLSPISELIESIKTIAHRKDIEILGEKKISLIQLQFLAIQLEDEPQFQELVMNFMAMVQENRKIIPHLQNLYEMLQSETTVAEMLSFFGNEGVAEEIIQGLMQEIVQATNQISRRTDEVEIKSQLRYTTEVTLKAGLEYEMQFGGVDFDEEFLEMVAAQTGVSPENLLFEEDSFATSDQNITLKFTYVTLFQEEYEAYSERTDEVFGNNAIDFKAPVTSVSIKNMEIEEPEVIVEDGFVKIEGYEGVELTQGNDFETMQLIQGMRQIQEYSNQSLSYLYPENITLVSFEEEREQKLQVHRLTTCDKEQFELTTDYEDSQDVKICNKTSDPQNDIRVTLLECSDGKRTIQYDEDGDVLSINHFVDLSESRFDSASLNGSFDNAFMAFKNDDPDLPEHSYFGLQYAYAGQYQDLDSNTTTFNRSKQFFQLKQQGPNEFYLLDQQNFNSERRCLQTRFFPQGNGYFVQMIEKRNENIFTTGRQPEEIDTNLDCSKFEIIKVDEGGDLYALKTQEGYLKACDNCTNTTNEEAFLASQSRLFADENVTLEDALKFTLEDVYFEAKVAEETSFIVTGFDIEEQESKTPLYGEAHNLIANSENAQIVASLISQDNATLKISQYLRFQNPQISLQSGLYYGGQKIKGFSSCRPDAWCFIEAGIETANETEIEVRFIGMAVGDLILAGEIQIQVYLNESCPEIIEEIDGEQLSVEEQDQDNDTDDTDDQNMIVDEDDQEWLDEQQDEEEIYMPDPSNIDWGSVCAEEHSPENGFCNCDSEIIYGAEYDGTIDLEKGYAILSVPEGQGGLECKNDIFGDPLPGVGKKCFCAASAEESESIESEDDEQEAYWYNFIVNEEIESYAVIATYDEDFETFYLWTPAGDVCMLKPDREFEDILGFNVSDTDEENGCKFIEENGWSYAYYTFDEETKDPVSIVGPQGNDWIFISQEGFASQYPEWFNEFNTMINGGDMSSGEEEPVWYNFIVNEEMESYAVLATYDEEFETFYLWTPAGDVCMLTPDWTSDNTEDNIGFFVNDTNEENGCKFVEENGWTYAPYTFDEETQEPVSIIGPWGNDWMFISPENFAFEYPDWFSEFNNLISGGDMSGGEEEPYWYNFIVNEEMESYAVLATYDEEFETFYLWTPAGDVCMLTPDWTSDNTEDNIGFFVNDTNEENGCKFVEENGWTYAPYTFDEETQEPVSIIGPWGNDWMFISPEIFASDYPSWYDEFNTIIYGGDMSSGEEEPVWYNFIVNEEMESYAVLATYDEEFETFYLWTPAGDVCMLTPDWTSDNTEDNIGFFVNDTNEENGCKFVEENGWTYAPYTFDEETQEPVSIIGPWGNDWMFISPEIFASDYPSWYDEFNTIIYGGDMSSGEEEPVWYNFIVNEEMESYAVLATYDEEFETFYLWTPAGDVCMLTPDWTSDNTEDNIGFFVNDTNEENGCKFVEENGWTYAPYTFDEETQEPVSIIGPWGNDWMFISPENFAFEYPDWFSEFNNLINGGDMSGGEEEPYWYNFIVNEEMESYAVIVTYDETFETAYLWTPAGDVCMLTPDWKSDNKEDNIWGFFVNDTDEENGCKFIEENGWSYASYTYDEDTGQSVSIVGPWGNDWMFIEPEDFASEYPDWFADFNTLTNGEDIKSDQEEELWYRFIVNEENGFYAMVVKQDEPFTMLVFATTADELCILTPDWKTDNPEDNAWGFFVSDADGKCPYIQDQNWTYSEYKYDNQTQEPISLKGPYGNEWLFMEQLEFAAEYPDWFNEFIASSNEENSSGGRRLSLARKFKNSNNLPKITSIEIGFSKVGKNFWKPFKTKLEFANLFAKKMGLSQDQVIYIDSYKTGKSLEITLALVDVENDHIRNFFATNPQFGALISDANIVDHNNRFSLIVKDGIFSHKDRKIKLSHRNLNEQGSTIDETHEYSVGDWYFESAKQIAFKTNLTDGTEKITRWTLTGPHQIQLEIASNEPEAFIFVDPEDDLNIKEAEILGQSSYVWSRNTMRQMSVKDAIFTQIDNFNPRNPPQLNCHFAGATGSGSSEGQEPRVQDSTSQSTSDLEFPWIKMNVNTEHEGNGTVNGTVPKVQKIKIFNIRNGAKSSNLEDAKIFIGNVTDNGTVDPENEKMCAQVGPVLPQNAWVTFTCEDPDSTVQANVFNTEQSTFDGIPGTYVRIQASKGDILGICDPSITSQVNDQELLNEINTNLDTCKGYYGKCQELFNKTGEEPQYENLINCYELHGFERTGNFCLTKQPVIHDNFFYKLKNKYECLTSNDNQFAKIDVPEEVSNCLNKYYDYMIETCLEDYESQYMSDGGLIQVGFYGHNSSVNTTNNLELRKRIHYENMPRYDDFRSAQNDYWTIYGPYVASLRIEIPNGVKPTELQSNSSVSNETIKEEMNDWLCSQTRGIFYSNPYNQGEQSENEFTINLKCEVVFMDYKEDQKVFDQAVVHYYMDKTLEGNVASEKFKDKDKEDFVKELVINRSVLNEQYFQVDYNKELEFVPVNKTEMYVFTQDVQNFYNGIGVILPEISDKKTFDEFRSNSNTMMLQESHAITIAETKVQSTILESVPETIKQKDVPNTQKEQVLGINVFFISETINEQIKISPKYDVREAEDLEDDEKEGPWYSNRIDLRFKFQERIFEFMYIGYMDLVSSLGGIGAILNEIIGSFGTLLIIVFFADLVYMISQKHKHELRKFQTEKITKLLPYLILAAEKIDKETIQEEEQKPEEKKEANKKQPKWLKMYLERNSHNIHLQYIAKMQKFHKFYEKQDERDKEFQSGKDPEEPKENSEDAEALQDLVFVENADSDHPCKLSDDDKQLYRDRFLIDMHEKYGEASLNLKMVYDYIMDDFYITRKLLRDKVNIHFLDLCAYVKKNVSFFGIYTMAEECDTLSRKIEFYKKKLHIALQKFHVHHKKLVETQKKQKKDQDDNAITIDYDKSDFYPNWRQDKPFTKNKEKTHPDDYKFTND